MKSIAKWVVLVVLFAASASSAEDNSFEGCLRRDSISCVQLNVYRKLRAVFGQDTINLLGGFQLVKTEGARSLDDNTVDEKMAGDVDVSERQAVLEEFAYQSISSLFSDRTLRWGISPAIDQVATTARMAVSSIPQDLRERLTTYIVEGRGKKKVLKSLIPILILAKMKLISMLGLAYVVITVIAKKALIASSIALAITVFISIKKLLAKHHAPVYYEVHSDPHHSSPVSHPDRSGPDRSGWAPAWSDWNSYDVHGSPSSHHLAYSPQKPTLR